MTQIPPPIDNTLSYANSPVGIREIAGRQRVLLLCILACIIVYVSMAVGQGRMPPLAFLALALAYFAAAITATVFVFLLATKIYDTGIGILMGILTLIPCVGLIILLIVNARATAILKQNGLKVGLLGATLPAHLK